MSEGLHVFGLVEASEAPAALVAAAEAPAPRDVGPVQAVAAGRLVALASRGPAAGVTPARRNLLGHARVLEAAMSRATVLPVRFGHLASSADALRATLAANEAEVLTCLADLRGRIEMGLRVTVDREQALAAIVAADPVLGERVARLRSDGQRGYQATLAIGQTLADRLAGLRRRAETSLLRALRPHVERHVLRETEADTDLLRCELLLTPDREPDLAAKLETAAVGLSPIFGAQPAVRLIGPSPPYSFVSLRMTWVGSRPTVATAE